MNLMHQMNETDLVKQAGMTTASYLNYAVRNIDEKLGEGYAARHPELICKFMEICKKDFALARCSREWYRNSK